MKENAIGHLVKTNPIQTQSNPIAERVKLMQSVYLQRIIKKNADKGYEKTNPKQTQFQRQKKSRYLVVSFLRQECKIETIVERVLYILQI